LSELCSRYNEHERKTSDAEGGICFSRAISEGAACAAGGKARQRGLVSEREHERKTSDAEGGICFSRAISEGAACAAGGKARQRGLVSERERKRAGTSEACSSRTANVDHERSS